MSFKKVDLEAQLGEDIKEASDADNRQRIKENEIPTAKQWLWRLKRWEVNDPKHLSFKPKINRFWIVLAILGFLYLLFR